jgi:hypothetical protein
MSDEWRNMRATTALVWQSGCAPVLEPIRACLTDCTHWIYGWAEACRAPGKIAKRHPKLRELVLSILGNVLRDAEHYDELVSQILQCTSQWHILSANRHEPAKVIRNGSRNEHSTSQNDLA